MLGSILFPYVLVLSYDLIINRHLANAILAYRMFILLCGTVLFNKNP